jgi:hypothetical protein
MPVPPQQSQSHAAASASGLMMVRGTDRLALAMEKMESTTSDALRCCEMLTKRARQLDSLTSPASDASSMLSRANGNLAATVILVKDARVHFDTVRDCEPAIDRLQKGVKDMEQEALLRTTGNRAANHKNSSTTTLLKHRNHVLTEQDIYAAGDSLEILRDAYSYFSERRSWKSTATTLGDLERVYAIGTDSMCRLLSLHLKKAGQSVRPKRNTTIPGKKDSTAPSDETAHQVRDISSLFFWTVMANGMVIVAADTRHEKD